MSKMVKLLIEFSDVNEDEFEVVLSEEALAEFVLTYKIKDFGKEFFTDYLEKRKTKYKEIINFKKKAKNF